MYIYIIIIYLYVYIYINIIILFFYILDLYWNYIGIILELWGFEDLWLLYTCLTSKYHALIEPWWQTIFPTSAEDRPFTWMCIFCCISFSTLQRRQEGKVSLDEVSGAFSSAQKHPAELRTVDIMIHDTLRISEMCQPLWLLSPCQSGQSALAPASVVQNSPQRNGLAVLPTIVIIHDRSSLNILTVNWWSMKKKQQVMPLLHSAVDINGQWIMYSRWLYILLFRPALWLFCRLRDLLPGTLVGHFRPMLFLWCYEDKRNMKERMTLRVGVKYSQMYSIGWLWLTSCMSCSILSCSILGTIELILQLCHALPPELQQALARLPFQSLQVRLPRSSQHRTRSFQAQSACLPHLPVSSLCCSFRWHPLPRLWPDLSCQDNGTLINTQDEHLKQTK